MRADFQGLHSYIRRPSTPAAALVPFYRDVVGLPIIRPIGEMVTFWAGEDYGFEIKCDERRRPLDDDPESAQCLPVFRTHDLAATEARLAEHRRRPFRRTATEFGRTTWYRCPDGHLIGFEERSVRSPFAADRTALERWHAGPVGLAGVGPLAPELHYLARIHVRVHDVAAVSRFYDNDLGLEVVGTESGARVHTLGDTALLVLSPGGRARPVPADRIENGNIISTRIHDFDDFVEHMRATGIPQCGSTIEFDTGTRAGYLADPEGNLFGFQQRTVWGDYPEDLESARRWSARTDARTAGTR